MLSKPQYLEIRDAYFAKLSKFELLIGPSYLITIVGFFLIAAHIPTESAKIFAWFAVPFFLAVGTLIGILMAVIFRIKAPIDEQCSGCGSNLFKDKYKTKQVTSSRHCWKCETEIFRDDSQLHTDKQISKSEFEAKFKREYFHNRKLSNFKDLLFPVSLGTLVATLCLGGKFWLYLLPLSLLLGLAWLYLSLLLASLKFSLPGGYFKCHGCDKPLATTRSTSNRVLRTNCCPDCGIRVLTESK